jgi:hypothetical protein
VKLEAGLEGEDTGGKECLMDPYVEGGEYSPNCVRK